MKLIKLATMICGAFTFQMQANAQVNYYTVDLRTGIDNSGNLLSPMVDDPRWTVRTPTSAVYQPVKIGTATPYDPNYSSPSGADPSYQPLSLNSYMLTPYPWTQTELSQPGHFAYAQPGDMKYSAPNGTYYYRLQFTVNFPACKRPNSLKLYVRSLTGLERADQINLNGMAPVNVADYSLSNFAPHVPPENAAFARAAYISTTSLYQQFPHYVIPLTPSHLINGVNYLYITVKKESSYALGAGLMVDAELQYNYGPDPVTSPTAQISVSNPMLCVGNPNPPLLNINLSNLVNIGASATISANLPGFPVTIPLSSYTPVSVNLDPINPAIYTLTITSNGVNQCAITKTYKTYSCNVVAINLNPNNWTGRVFHVSGDPANTDEHLIPGFETEWKLEELDAFTNEPLYQIVNPSNWSIPAGESNLFNGFTVDNSYHGVVADLTGDPSVEGTFSADKIYRFTRSYRTALDPAWKDYSVILGPGYTELSPPEPFTTSVNKINKSGDNQLTVYPNPGKGMFHIKVPANNKGQDMILYNAVGKQLFTFSGKPEMTEYRIDLSGYASGIYFIGLTGTQQMQKIIIE